LSKNHCGHCDFHGDVRSPNIFCLVDNKWNPNDHTCDRFSVYVKRNREERFQLARDKQREEKKARQRQEDREFDERLAQVERDHAEELAQKDREHIEGMAQKERDHATELARLQREQNKKLWRASWWWQLVLIIMGALIGYFVKLI